jgi:hypothetical protein
MGAVIDVRGWFALYAAMTIWPVETLCWLANPFLLAALLSLVSGSRRRWLLLAPFPLGLIVFIPNAGDGLGDTLMERLGNLRAGYWLWLIALAVPLLCWSVERRRLRRSA